VAQIEKANPCFRERYVESRRPGELLCADTFYVGRLKGVGKVYLHAVVAVLRHDVLPFYRERTLSITAVLTDNGREFCGTDSHPCEV